jgi:hypothetical protein
MRGREEYLLTTKLLFCGYCREMMTGYGGMSKSGKAYLYYACKNAKKKLCGIINIFFRAVYLWDDKLTIILNGGDKPITIDDILLDEIEADNAEFECSRMVAGAPPKHKTPKRVF